MRIFEILVLAVQSIWLISFLSNRFKRWKHKIGIASLLVIGIHLIVEGYRWQLGLAYVIALLIAISLVKAIILSKKIENDSIQTSKPKWKLLLIGLFGTLYVAMTILLALLFPVFQLPTATGPYQTGVITEHLVDESRNEHWTNSSEYREMMVTVWYPVDPEIESNVKAKFPQKEIAGAISTLFHLPSFLFDYLKSVDVQSYENAPVSKQVQTYPVLIFSHGYGGTRTQNLSQMEELASHGYVIVSIDHTYDSGYTVFPDGREVKMVNSELSDEGHHQAIQTRSQDASFVLDQLNLWNSESDNLFANKLDLEKVGMFGHSYGGATTAKTLATDERFKAGINMDGALYGNDVTQGLSQPFMNIIATDTFTYTPTEQELEMMNMSQDEYIEDRDRRLREINYFFEEGVRGDSYKITFFSGDHMSFSDLPFYTPLMSFGFDEKKIHEVMNSNVLAFFNRYVKGIEDEVLKEESNSLFQLEVK
ncbi:alpha/beta hydrolase family protein [Bacillus alkalicellulosilyticus]|uniref:alpha/beta hydrolase family protein n=1 Tax=Alkalihalobacterium alkalicellulosilyticum TaxID=1912214 RepID=UPI001482ED69|nr:prolyl oligopeptidase family serine peptidase [Bacillus alkalicellulosilyticus]